VSIVTDALAIAIRISERHRVVIGASLAAESKQFRYSTRPERAINIGIGAEAPIGRLQSTNNIGFEWLTGNYIDDKRSTRQHSETQRL